MSIDSGKFSITLEVRVDDSLVGDISYVPTFDRRVNTSALFESTRFNKVKIEKV